MSFWGEVVKTVREASQSRIKIDVTASFISGGPDPRHTVRIRNVGLKPLVLQNWEIQSGGFLRRRHVESLDGIMQGDLHDEIIPPMGEQTLEFKEAYYFSAGVRRHSIRLWFAGRKRPIRRSIP